MKGMDGFRTVPYQAEESHEGQRGLPILRFSWSVKVLAILVVVAILILVTAH